MESNLESTKSRFEFKTRHLLIIGILALAFSLSFMIRSQAADYGFELNEFDPFFNYRATQHIVENGLESYFDWHDDKSWHPNGRNVSATSQVMLHITAATLYKIFGFGASLYDFTIIFPVVFGSFTAIALFALVRTIGGTTAGLFAALLFTVSDPIIIRGTLGWFKSEPLGLFFAIVGLYLFLSGIKFDKGKISLLKLVAGGIFLGFGLSAWGGIVFFIIPLGIFIFALPFFRKDHNFLLWSIPVFVLSLILIALSFERPGIHFVTGYGGFALIGPTVFLVICIIIQKFSNEHKIRNGLLFLGGIIGAGFGALVAGAVGLPAFRYLNAINPFLTATDPLTTSVAEHQTTTTELSFFYFSVLMIFAGIGIWFILRNRSNSSTITLRNDMTFFALILGITGVYISSAFVRLELFAAIAVILLASIGLSMLTSEILSRKSDEKKSSFNSKTLFKISYVVIIIVLLLIPITLPEKNNWISAVKAPLTILNGGTTFNIATNDWPHALTWIKNNTPEDAIVASWWDYGYWITTLGERTSLADNATLIDWQIQLLGKMFFSTLDDAWKLLQGELEYTVYDDTRLPTTASLDADYVLIYIAAQKITDEDQPGIYLLRGGGDESKKIWFMQIAEERVLDFVHNDGFTPTDHFWSSTFLGKMIPFSPIGYADLSSNLQYETYTPGTVGLYQKEIKLPTDGDGPFRLVYSSPSFDRTSAGPISGVFIYELNKDYKPGTDNEISSQENIIISELETSTQTIVQKESAIVTTTFGDIIIEFNEEIAPNTVENFKNLAQSGFYDGTIFHRIVPGFVIQAGDPNTIENSRDTWGMGDPGYTILPEFSDLKHRKYVVSMARGADVNSAGSQFFIVLDDAPWLDDQYTIFGEVISGQEIVEQIASLETNSDAQPVDPTKARIKEIKIFLPKS